jgi:hypothetical protein
MKNHRENGSDEQIEEHSLPGTNMAGKKAPEAECEPDDERHRSQPEGKRLGSDPDEEQQ